MIEWVLPAAVLLAFMNGANDNMKGVATLYGSGSLSYRSALAMATVTTALGSLLSVAIGTGLLRAFSAKGIIPDELLSPVVLTAVALGAAVTLVLATRLGFPISTTHALVGALAGGGWAAAGSQLDLSALAAIFLLPLLASPLIAIALAWGISRVSERRAPPGEGPSPDTATPRSVAVGHLVSAGAVGFARGLNDTPKILGLVVGAGVASVLPAAVLVTVAMALGGIVASRRVIRTLAKRITPMSPRQGFSANVATSMIVIGASRLGLPVSTTHVSTGGIFGIGMPSRGLRWGVAGSVVGAWVLTLPIAAALGALFLQVLAAR